MNKIRVLISDHSPIFREGLCRLLAEESDIEVIATPVNNEETMSLVRQTLPDVAIIGAGVPQSNAVEMTKRIKEYCKSTAVIVLGNHTPGTDIIASIRAGSVAYLSRNVPFIELTNAIRLVNSGEAVFDLKALDHILYHIVTEVDKKKRSPQLHNRELEILKLSAQGMRNREIARQLVISERTVQTHLVNIFRKLGVGSRTEAVLRALKDGWLTYDDLP